MNNHAGWGSDGRCVYCLSKDSSTPCMDPSSKEFAIRVINLERDLRNMTEERDWWMKKHQQDCLSMRQIGRREGAHEMKKIIKDMIWEYQHDEFLDSEISNVEYKEDHPINCSWWGDWHQCNCGAFDKR